MKKNEKENIKKGRKKEFKVPSNPPPRGEMGEFVTSVDFRG